jgi:hypothetical protein
MLESTTAIEIATKGINPVYICIAIIAVTWIWTKIKNLICDE